MKTLVFFTFLIFSSCVYAQNVVPFIVNHKWGIMTTDRKAIINPEYDFIKKIDKSDHYLLCIKDKMGAVNSFGNHWIPNIYDSIGAINNNYVIAKKDSLYYLYDTSKILFKSFKIIKNEGKGILSFEGKTEKALLNMNNSKFVVFANGNKQMICILNRKNYYLLKRDSLFGVIDDSLNILISFDYLHIKELKNITLKGFTEENTGYFVVKKKQGFGVKDSMNKEIISSRFNHISMFNNQIICSTKDSCYVYSNQGNLIYKNKFEKLYQFGNYWVVKQNELFGVLNNSGVLVEKLINDSIYEFNNFWYFMRNGRWGIKNNAMTTLVEPKYEKITPVNDKDGYFYIQNEGLKGVQNSNREIIVPIMFSNISYLKDGYFLTLKDGDFGLYLKNKKIFNNEMDKIYRAGDFRIICEQSGRCALYNNSGQKLCETYYAMQVLKNNTILVYNGTHYGMMDMYGKLLIPCEYEVLTYLGNGLIQIENKNKKGILNVWGNIVVKPVYKDVEYVSSMKCFLVYGFTDEYDLRSLDDYRLYRCLKKMDTLHLSKHDSIKYNLRYFDKAKLDSIHTGIMNKVGLVSGKGQKVHDTMFYDYQIQIDDSIKQIRIETDSCLYVAMFDEKGENIENIQYFNWVKIRVKQNTRRRTSAMANRRNFVWERNNNKKMDSYNLWGLRKRNSTQMAVDYGFTNYNPLSRGDSTYDITFIGKKFTGIVNSSEGREMVPCMYEKFYFEDLKTAGVARCKTPEGSYRLMNEKYELLPQYFGYIDDFRHVYIRAQDNKNKWGVLDTNGVFLFKPAYDSMLRCFNNKFIVMMNKKWGEINIQNNLTIPFEYDELNAFDDESKPFEDYIKSYNYAWKMLYLKTSAGKPYKEEKKELQKAFNNLQEMKYEWRMNCPYYKACKIVKSKNKKNKDIFIKQYGAIDTTNQLFIPCEYDDIKFFKSSIGEFFGVKKNGLWGVCDKRGKLVIPISYNKISYLSSDVKEFFKMSLTNSYTGFIDTLGLVKSEAKYKEAFEMKNGRARIVLYNGKQGFIDKNGDEIITPVYEKAKCFNENYAPVCTNKKWSMINTNGDVLFHYDCLDLGRLSENRIYFATEKKKSRNQSNSTVVYGFLDKNGIMTIKPKFESVTDFCNGGAVVMKKGKWGVIDSSGSWLIKPKYDSLLPMNKHGICVFFTNNKLDKGLVNKTGKILLKAGKYFEISDFNEGICKYVLGAQTGFIDTLGNEVIKPLNYSKIFDLNNGLVRIYTEGGYGYMNRDSIKIAPIYKIADDFRFGLAWVKDKKGKEHLIDTTGKIIHQNVKNPLRPIETKTGYGVWSTGRNKFYFANANNEYIVKYGFSSATSFTNGVSIVKDHNDKFGLVSNTGKFLVYPIYDRLDYYSEGMSVFSFDEQYAVFAPDGKQIGDCLFYSILPISESLVQLNHVSKTFYLKPNGEYYTYP